MSKRDWQTYFVQHHFAERADEPWPELDEQRVRAHADQKLAGWDTHVLRLPAPVIANSSELVMVSDLVLSEIRVRLYPPFPLDRRGEISGSFEDCWLPEGDRVVDKFVRLPPDAARGLTSEQRPVQGARFCQGLRIDTQGAAQLHATVQTLLEQLCQHTHQWWLRGRTDPFQGIRRLGCEVNRDFSFRKILRHHGAGDLLSPWCAAIESQPLLGIEIPLTQKIWQRCCYDTAAGMRGDMGTLFS